MCSSDLIKILREGGIVAFPTESSYGLACDPFNEKAIRKLHELKKEPFDKPVLLICASKHMVHEIAFLDANGEKIVDKLMPAPLTLVAKKKKSVPDFLSKETVAFRIPSNEIAREFSKKFGKPITATSANLHGKEPAFTVKQVEKYFPGLAILDGGKLKKIKPSTIFDLTKNKIIRNGPINMKKINMVLKG